MADNETTALQNALAAAALQTQLQAAAAQSTAAQQAVAAVPQYSVPAPAVNGSTYQQVLHYLEECSRDIRPSYTGNKMCTERLKRNISNARNLVRQAIAECERDRQKALNATSSS